MGNVIELLSRKNAYRFLWCAAITRHFDFLYSIHWRRFALVGIKLPKVFLTLPSRRLEMALTAFKQAVRTEPLTACKTAMPAESKGSTI